MYCEQYVGVQWMGGEIVYDWILLGFVVDGWVDCLLVLVVWVVR